MITVEYLRSFRILGFSFFDTSLALLGTALLAPVLSWLFKKISIHVPKKNWIILMIPLSVVAHVLVGQDTMLTRYVLYDSGHWVVKLVILTLFILGLMGIKLEKNKS